MSSNEENKIENYTCLEERQNVGESKKQLAVELLRIRSFVSGVSPDIDEALEFAVRSGMLVGRKEVTKVLKACREWLECNQGELEDYGDLSVGEEEGDSRWFAECLLRNYAHLLDDSDLESVSGSVAGTFDIWLCTEEVAEVLAVCRSVLAYSGRDIENYTKAAISELKDSMGSCSHVAPSA